MSDRSFDTGGGVSLADVINGGRESVLALLRRELEQAETEVAELEETLQDATGIVVKWQIEIARANARREAIELALASANEAFS